MAVYCVILAGGGGLRLGGVNKSAIRMGSENLATSVYNRLNPQSDFLSITNTNLDDSSGLPHDVANLVDGFTPQIGPLGGIYAGYCWAKSIGGADNEDFLLVAPVDTPCFPTDFVRRARSAIGEADVLVARYGDQEYPTCSLWRLGAASSIASTRGSAPNNSIRCYLENLDVTYLNFAPYHVENPFKNVNKISDLIHLDRGAAKIVGMA
ncbi:NTP transferase domain-containing protein [Maritalea sp.]|jgi:molybdopterin-guanine dinucleotide biosynthesis protein A|uniref:NTP transferase domain-containing protein n=1 Tax=Maritalea sp. TaxID=2003361 RepID=UPI0039E4BE16